MSDKNDGPVLDDENFINVDPDFANWSNEVDRPLPMEEVEDYNVPEEFREKKDDKKDSDKKDDEKEEPKAPAPAAPKPPVVTPPASK